MKKLKLALIVDLLNNQDFKYPLSKVKKVLKGFGDEIGKFLSIDLLSTQSLNTALDQETFELRYENLTVNLELVRNKNTHSTFIKDFVLL